MILFESIPVWGVFLATVILIVAGLDVGFRLGRWRARSGGAKAEVSGSMVGAAMGLLAFMLAFTFNGAAGRHDARKQMVVEEVNAIEAAWLRSGFLEESHQTQVRGLLRDYTQLRVQAAVGQVAAEDVLRQSDEIHAKLWASARAAVQSQGSSDVLALFVESLNDVVDVHVRRVMFAWRSHVPVTIWVTLYALLVVGVVMLGIQMGHDGVRHYGIEIALAASFSLVLFLIVDLDRPQQGLIKVSQQSMVDLQTRISR
jgi:hypothetical protein